MTKTERRALALLDWYRTNRRDLPWRGERHPWPILVSEIMLQQTSAGRVVPFYRRFMARFPTPVALADTPAAEALALWSGLGYNRWLGVSRQQLTVSRQTAGQLVRLNCNHSPELSRTPRLALRVLPSENRSRPPIPICDAS